MRRTIQVTLEHVRAEADFQMPKIVVTPLPDYVARINKNGDVIYIDPSVPKRAYRPIIFHDMATWILVSVFGFKAKDVEDEPAHEHIEETVEKLEGIDDAWYDQTIEKCMGIITARDPKPPLPEDCLKD
jgi:hypothetical protein